MATLLQLSNVGDYERGQAAAGIALQRSALLANIDQNSGYEEEAHDFDYRTIEGAASLQPRARGGSYSATDKSPGAKQTGELSIYGDRIDIDISDIRDAMEGRRSIDSWLDKRITRDVRNWVKMFENELFEGDGTGDKIVGLAKLLDGTTLPGFSTETAVINAVSALSTSPNSLDISSGNDANQKAFLESLMEWIREVENPSALYMNRSLYGRMTTLAHEHHIRGEARDQFGNPVPTFDGVPMVPMLDGSIKNDEPDDATSPVDETTSLYIVSPAEASFSLVTNSGLEWDEKDWQEAKESAYYKWELRSNWKIEEKDSLRRVRNIKL